MATILLAVRVAAEDAVLVAGPQEMQVAALQDVTALVLEKGVRDFDRNVRIKKPGVAASSRRPHFHRTGFRTLVSCRW